jgi:hypothetical protein
MQFILNDLYSHLHAAHQRPRRILANYFGLDRPHGTFRPAEQTHVRYWWVNQNQTFRQEIARAYPRFVREPQTPALGGNDFVMNKMHYVC